MLNPIHLRTLTAVLRTGSFAAAAKDLGYTSSAISQQISTLEKDARVTLFERSARSIRSTPAAALLSERAAEVLALLDDLDDEARRIAGGQTGRLRIGSFPTASEHVLPTALASMANDFPDVSIEIEEAEPDVLIPMVVERRIDVAVVYEYDLVPRSWPRNLRRTDLVSEDLVLLLPSGHRLSTAEVNLRDLEAEVWISTAHGSAGSECLHRLCGQQGFVPHIAFRTNDYDVVRRFVREGMGVALVPELGVQPSAGVRTARIHECSAQRRTIAVHRRVGRSPIAGSALTALVASAAQLALRWDERMLEHQHS